MVEILGLTIDPTTIVGPLIGAFAGVGLGVIANELWRRKLASDRKLFFRKLLLHEIKRSSDLLKSSEVNLIPVDAWNSLVNSGDMALFAELAIDLGDAYFDIQNYNYEAKRVRDAVETESLNPQFRIIPPRELLEDFKREQITRSPALKSSLNVTKSLLIRKLKALERSLTSLELTWIPGYNDPMYEGVKNNKF